MRKLKTRLVVLGFLTIAIGYISLNVYFNYKIYKAKYPNTSLWMYIVDDKN